jgi:hypothetical protein
MQVFRAGALTLAALVLSFAYSSPARSDIRPVAPTQTLPRPPGSAFTGFGDDVAIDGTNIIVLASYDGGKQALLYRRNSSGLWAYRRTLLTWTGPNLRSNVAMKNGIAAIQFGDEISLFEYSGGDYVQATSVAPIRHPGGLAISGKSVLIGGNNCDYDAVIYEKLASGSWDITGRIDDNQGACGAVVFVDLNYDTALLSEPYALEATAWRRNGTSVDWVPAGVLALPPTEGGYNAGWALQGATAVTPHGSVWRRTGTSTWTRQTSVVTSVDEGCCSSLVVYRDGVLVTKESSQHFPISQVYIEASPGQFEHVATLPAFDATWPSSFDVSGRTVVVAMQDYGGSQNEVRVFNLASQLRAPNPIVNDFEDRDASDLTFYGGQFALATRGTGRDVLAQSATNALAIAVFTGSDWPDDQRVEADVTPTFTSAGSWVGLVARYVDANNYYYLAIRSNLTYGIYKRVNGVDTLLRAGSFNRTPPPTFRATLTVVRNQISVDFGFEPGDIVTDGSLSHGRGGVVTGFARADFDNLHVAGTSEPVPLFTGEYAVLDPTGQADVRSRLNELSGDWEVTETCVNGSCWFNGLSQRDTSGSAVAITGTPVANQDLTARMRVDAYAVSQQGAWIGLLARYVDASNHYYVTVRSTGDIQIRKIVNGVVTVLGTFEYLGDSGEYFDVRFLVINDQLQLYVNGELEVTAHDHDIAKGQYGIATYRAAANWESFAVAQP